MNHGDESKDLNPKPNQKLEPEMDIEDELDLKGFAQQLFVKSRDETSEDSEDTTPDRAFVRDLFRDSDR